MTHVEMEAALRRYAPCDVSWRELQELGSEDYVQVLGGLGGLGELGLRPPMSPLTGPNVEARVRGRALLRAALLRNP